MKKLLPMILLATTLLSGCLPAVFVAGATTGGVVISDRRNIETIVQDKKITYQSLIDLNADPLLKKGSHLCVATFNRVVLLTGEAKTPELKSRAYEVVKDIAQVRRINNEIAVARPLGTKERSLDVWITTKVKTAMVAERGLNSTQIKVLTNNGTVYLMGLVTHQQTEVAIEVARQVKGVKKVVTLFEYVG